MKIMKVACLLHLAALCGCSIPLHDGVPPGIELEVSTLELPTTGINGLLSIRARMTVHNHSKYDLRIGIAELGSALGDLRLWSLNEMDEWRLLGLGSSIMMTPSSASIAVRAQDHANVDVAMSTSSRTPHLVNERLIPEDQRPPPPREYRYTICTEIVCEVYDELIKLPMVGVGRLKAK